MYYGNNANGYGYSPNRSYDVDRFNQSTYGNYPTTYANGNKQNGYYYSACSSYTNRPKTIGRYLANGQYAED